MTDDYSSEQPAPPAKVPFLRRTGVLLATAAVAVVAVAGGVGYALSSGSSSNSAGPAVSATATNAAGKPHHRHKHALVGTIASENGNTWIVNATDGAPTTVTITPTTHFGTRADQQTQSQFVVGNQIAVRGQTTDNTVTARWVVQLKDLQLHRNGGSPSPSPAPQATPAQPSPTN